MDRCSVPKEQESFTKRFHLVQIGFKLHWPVVCQPFSFPEGCAVNLSRPGVLNRTDDPVKISR